MAPASMVQMVQNTIGRNINNLQDLGDVSYELARPILRQITNPEHLRALEFHSPQIADKDAEIWKLFINRDIPNSHDKMAEPKNRASFCYEVYRELKDREEQELKKDQEQLRQAFMQHEMHKEANKSNIIDKVVAPNVRRLPKYADGRPNPLAGKSSTHAPTLRNAKGGQQIIRALRNQTRQAVQQKKHANPRAMGRVPESYIKERAEEMKEEKKKAEMERRLASREVRRKVEGVAGESGNGEEMVEGFKKIGVPSNRREVKEVVRRARARDTTRQAAATPMAIDPPTSTTPASGPITPPARRPTPPKEAYLSPPSNPILSDRGSLRITEPSRAMGLHMATTSPTKTPKGPDPAALERKSGSPIPEVTLNGSEKPNVPVHFQPASTRRPPPSIFAPKPKKQRVV